jgi:hypothetical protein
LKAKKKQEEQDQVLAIYCPKCRKKHAPRECPLDKIQVCGLCTDNHATDDCPRLKELQDTHIEEGQGMESLYYLAPRKTWQPRFTSMSQNFAPQFSQQFPQNFQNPIQNSLSAPILGKIVLLSRAKTNLLKVGKGMLKEIIHTNSHTNSHTNLFLINSSSRINHKIHIFSHHNLHHN